MSKGSKPRPLGTTRESFNDNWDAIFPSKKDKKEEPSEAILISIDKDPFEMNRWDFYTDTTEQLNAHFEKYVKDNPHDGIEDMFVYVDRVRREFMNMLMDSFTVNVINTGRLYDYELYGAIGSEHVGRTHQMDLKGYAVGELSTDGDISDIVIIIDVD
jgi:hypothetical protein